MISYKSSFSGLVLLLALLLLLSATFVRKLSASPKTIYRQIKNKFPVPLAKIITAQAAHETAINGKPFESKLVKENNNIFGMGFATKRETTAINEKNKFANYESIKSSIEDFEIYSRYRNLDYSISSIEGYCRFIKSKGYYEDSISNYTKGVTYWYNRFEKEGIYS